jgi:hypothetical protein
LYLSLVVSHVILIFRKEARHKNDLFSILLKP